MSERIAIGEPTPEQQTKLRKGMGWIPDIPDKRDHKFNLGIIATRLGATRPSSLPSSTDLRAGCTDVEDQGQLGSCTANALVGLVEFLQKKRGEPIVDLSRLFVYYNERVYIHTIKEDSGAIIRDGIKSLRMKGVCPESEWPYDEEVFATKPPPDCFSSAKQHKTILYQRLNTLTHMRGALAAGLPFVFGFAVYESFMSDEVAESGVVPMPDVENEQMVGGHAVMVVGYDDNTERFICRNSWGTDWGNDGYFTMPYAYLTDRDLSDDFWVIVI